MLNWENTKKSLKITTNKVNLENKIKCKNCVCISFIGILMIFSNLRIIYFSWYLLLYLYLKKNWNYLDDSKRSAKEIPQ